MIFDYWPQRRHCLTEKVSNVMYCGPSLDQTHITFKTQKFSELIYIYEGILQKLLVYDSNISSNMSCNADFTLVSNSLVADQSWLGRVKTLIATAILKCTITMRPTTSHWGTWVSIDTIIVLAIWRTSVRPSWDLSTGTICDGQGDHIDCLLTHSLLQFASRSCMEL